MAEVASLAPPSGRVAGSAQALLVVDDDCVCVEASLGACRLLGAARGAIVGHAVEELLEASSRERFNHVWQAFRTTGGHAEPFALEAPARVVEVAVTVSAGVLPERHMIALEPARVAEPSVIAAGESTASRPFGSGPPPGGPIQREPTAREREVLSLLAGGATDVRIAKELKLSPATVQTHVRNAKAKLGARTRAQAVAMALQRGLIDPR